LCIALIILIPLAFFIFFDPNAYKPEIAAFIKDKTGFTVEIQDPIQLTYFPQLGVAAHKVVLSSSLLSAKIKVVQFELPLEMFIQQAKRALTSKEKKGLPFMPEKVIVEEATAYYEDKASRQALILKEGSLKAYPTQTQATFKSHFAFSVQKDKQPVLQGKGQLNGDIVFSDFSLKGNLLIDKLLAHNMALTQVKATLQKNKKGHTFNPITAHFYGGVLHATFMQNKIQGKIDHFQLQPLLYDLRKEDRLRADASVQFSLTPTPQSLDGVVHFRLEKGNISGIDLPYYLATANALLKKQVASRADTKQTPFDTLTGTLFMQNNVINNPDLVLLSPDLRANGKGNIDLRHQTIAYQLQAWRQYQDNQPHPNAYPLAIKIKGPLSRPQIEPDMDLYLKMALTREAEKQIKKQIERVLGTSEEGEEKAEKLKNKIEEKLQKKLKKIFK